MEAVYIIKIGGETLNNESALDACIQSCANSRRPIILVHGGGRKASELAEKLGVEQQLIDGRRITSAETLELCLMVYAGLLNKSIVAKFYKNGRKAAGLTGADFNCIVAQRRQHPSIDFGMVGDVEKVDATLFEELISKQIIPVVSSITLGADGMLLNTNADSIAAAVALAMAPRYKVHLVFCFGKEGVLANPDNNASALPTIDLATFEAMKASGQIATGMIPKLQNAFEVVSHGAAEVRIINSQKLSDYFAGTTTGTLIV